MSDAATGSKERQPRHRNFMLTIFPDADRDEAFWLAWFKDVNCRYLVVGEELCPETNKKHYHGAIIFDVARTMSSMIKAVGGGVNVQISKYAHTAVEYATKEGSLVFEKGDKPDIPAVRSAKGGEANKRKWQEVANNAVAGNLKKIQEDNPQVFVQNYRTLTQIRKDHAVRPDDLDKIDNYWLRGPSRVGKSWKARHMFPGLSIYIKSANKWWDSYQGEDVVIIDDLGPQHAVLSHHLKIWADSYPFNAETKGSSLLIRPKHIVVTSNYSIDELFQGKGFDADLEPLRLRFKEELMTKRWVPPPVEESLPQVAQAPRAEGPAAASPQLGELADSDESALEIPGTLSQYVPGDLPPWNYE